MLVVEATADGSSCGNPKPERHLINGLTPNMETLEPEMPAP